MLLVSELHQTLPTCLLAGATSYKLAESLAHQGQQQDWIPVVGIFRHPTVQCSTVQYSTVVGIFRHPVQYCAVLYSGGDIQAPILPEGGHVQRQHLQHRDRP